MERSPATLNVMSAWSEQLVSRFAAQIRKRRQQLGMSAQQVADRTQDLGHPVSRTAIADYELGRRKDRLMLVDALALAEALRIPLGLLLYPEMPDGEVEALPHVTTTAMNAAESLIGVNGAHLPNDSENVDQEQRRREYMTTRDLYPMSIQMRRMRQEIEEVRLLMERDEVRANLEAFSNGLKKIEGIEAGMSELAERIRLMGGVVNDG